MGVFNIYKFYIVYKNKDIYKIDQKGPQWAPSVVFTLISDADCLGFYFLLLYLHYHAPIPRLGERRGVNPNWDSLLTFSDIGGPKSYN